MKKTRILALLLSVLMLVGMFAGCGKKVSYGKIDGQDIDAEFVDAYLYSMIQQYLSYGMDATQLSDTLNQEIDEEGTTLADNMKEQALMQIKYELAVNALAKENDIALTAEEKDAIKEQKQQTIDSMGGRAAFVEALKGMRMSEEIYDASLETGALSQKVFTALFNQGGKFAPDQASIISDLVANYVRVRHILVKGASTDEDFAQKQATANQIHARVTTGGEDFETVLADVAAQNPDNKDPGMDTHTEGYVFDKSGMLIGENTPFDSNFVAASLNLQPGQISPVVQSTSGLHVIKRLPFDEAYVTEHIAEYFSIYASNEFNAKITEIADGLTVSTNEAFANIDIASFIDSATAEDGHDHQ